MAKKKNLKIQFNEKLNNLLRIGTSRHLAKQVYKVKMEEKGIKVNNLYSEYIHSTTTAKNYREVINQFADWIRSNKPEVWQSKDLMEVNQSVAYEYLKLREGEGKSSSTISKDMSAINKVLDLGLRKKEVGLKPRYKKDITRSRNNTNDKLHKRVIENNAESILLAKACGLRRESVTKLTPSAFEYHKGLPVAINVEWEENGKLQHEKGGRYRKAQVLKEYQNEIHELIKGKELNSPIVSTHSRRIDNHSFRSDYVRDLFYELLNGRELTEELEEEIMKKVSQNLGHNRIDVVYQHYGHKIC